MRVLRFSKEAIAVIEGEAIAEEIADAERLNRNRAGGATTGGTSTRGRSVGSALGRPSVTVVNTVSVEGRSEVVKLSGALEMTGSPEVVKLDTTGNSVLVKLNSASEAIETDMSLDEMVVSVKLVGSAAGKVSVIVVT